MTIDKWRVVGGRVYKLAEAFEEMLDAVDLARKLKAHKYVFLHRTENGFWAVYWREKEEIECQPEYQHNLSSRTH
ncbi:MAG: hypothetical protein PVI03_06965 [Candidatus Thorarchaeota archaeon]|jgi:hypothetical protein